MGSTQRFSVPMAKDRFLSPTIKKHNACPGSYTPAASIVEHTLSNHKRVKRTKFSLDRSDILDHNWRTKDQSATPGPGAYSRFTEFGQDGLAELSRVTKK